MLRAVVLVFFRDVCFDVEKTGRLLLVWLSGFVRMQVYLVASKKQALSAWFPPPL